MIVYSERSADSKLRVPVISFSVKGKGSKEVVENVDACSDFGIRWGHFYSKRMVDDLLDLKTDGVIRVSMVHYNTGTPRLFFLIGIVVPMMLTFAEQEIRDLVSVLEKVLN